MFTNKKLLQNGLLMSSMGITCVMLAALIMIFLGMPLKASAGSTVTIRNNMDYAGFCALVKLDPSTSATLENDLTIDDHTDTIIGESRYNPYTGVFNGNGHTITIKKASSGFIHCLGEKDGDIGEVRNLNVVIENTTRLDDKVVGGIVDINRGKIITGCTVEIPKNGIISGNHVGGIVAENWSSVENSTVVNNGTLVASGNLACGGIAGINHSKIQNCVARGNGEIKIQGSGGAGGIAGYTFGHIIGCITEGELILTGNANNSSIGGIAGIIDLSACCENDLVYGDVTINYPAANTRAGGIVGYMKDKDGNNNIKYCFYNSTKPFNVMLDTANPILGDAAGGWLEQCYYNMETAGKSDNNGIGVGNIYWADTHDLMIKFPDSIDAGDGILCAGRYFYFKGKGIPVKYRGILVLGQSIAYIVNGNGTSYEVNSDEILMPAYDINISSVLKNDISMIKPRLTENSFTYDGTSRNPGTVDSDIGILKEGTGFTATYKDADGKKIRDCIETGKYTMVIWGAGDYAGHVEQEFTITQAKPSFTVTSNTVRDDLNVSAAVLKRSDESVKGELKLTETELLYGTNTYHWKFTPSDTHNYESVSGTVEITVTGHEWTDATCKAPKTCSVCGITEGQPTEHTWKAATCKEPKTCSVCGAKEGEPDPDAHDWGDWQVTTEPAPDKTGVRTRVCKRDPSHVETEKIAASGKLLTKMTSKGKNSLVITWTKMSGAAGYEVYFAQCNHKKKKNVCKKMADIKADKKLKYTMKKLKKQASYKAFVIAYTLVDGVKVYKDTSLTMHAYTSGGNKKYTNPSKVTVKKSRFTLAPGKTAKIKGKVLKPKKSKKKISTHAPALRYISSMNDVATVNKKGKIKARKKGSCKIYVIAVNGIRKTISVTVK